MLDLLHLDRLKEGKVLLAFSGGVDSTALFHLLLHHHISFDIAHVNYHTRTQSDQEEEHAIALAAQHSLTCHTYACHLKGGNFEHRAREERYRFFDYLMRKNGYTYLLTAHHLGDRLEWLMMQLCRGAGLPELLGIRSIDKKEEITIIRPLLEHDRSQIEDYLQTYNIPHFIDESNFDERYTRNRFRHHFATPMLQEHADAIRRSFRYLEEDASHLLHDVTIQSCEGLYYVSSPASSTERFRVVDTILKNMGYVMSSHEKERLKHEDGVIIGRKYVVWIDTEYLFITPYEETVLPKSFKEACRKMKIFPKMRGYLATHEQAYETITRLKGAQGPLQSE